MDKADIEPKVIVGLEGLGRGTDLDKFMRAVAAMSQIAPAAQVMPDLDMNKVTQFVFNAVGLDGEDVLKTEETKAIEAQAAQANQQQEMAQGMMGDAVKGAAPVIAKGAIEQPEATANAAQAMSGAMQQAQQ